MRDWTVQVTWVADAPVTIDTLERVSGRAGAASLEPTGRRVGAVLTVEADDAGTAVELALAETLSIVPGDPVAVEVITTEEHDRRLAAPFFPELVGISEIAQQLGVTRQRASTLQASAGFPAPVAQLASGPVYRRADLGRFLETWERKPGRPRRLPHLRDLRSSDADVQEVDHPASGSPNRSGATAV